jgi:hypothetical protein
MARSSQSKPPRDSLVQRLHGFCQGSALGFAYQHMHVLGHHYIAVHAEHLVLPDAFQCGFGGGTSLDGSEIWAPLVATKC